MEEYQYIDEVILAIGASLHQKSILKIYVNDVIDFMVDAGIKKEIAVSESCIGLVARGLLDVWNYGSGDTKLSPYFKEKVVQKAIGGGNTPAETHSCVEPITEEEIEKVVKEVL